MAVKVQEGGASIYHRAACLPGQKFTVARF
jgi:hypothetical protein